MNFPIFQGVPTPECIKVNLCSILGFLNGWRLTELYYDAGHCQDMIIQRPGQRYQIARREWKKHSPCLLPSLSSSPCRFQRWADRSSDATVTIPVSLIIEGICGAPIPTMHTLARATDPSAHPLSWPWCRYNLNGMRAQEELFWGKGLVRMFLWGWVLLFPWPNLPEM